MLVCKHTHHFCYARLRTRIGFLLTVRSWWWGQVQPCETAPRHIAIKEGSHLLSYNQYSAYRAPRPSDPIKSLYPFYKTAQKGSNMPLSLRNFRDKKTEIILNPLLEKKSIWKDNTKLFVALFFLLPCPQLAAHSGISTIGSRTNTGSCITQSQVTGLSRSALKLAVALQGLRQRLFIQSPSWPFLTLRTEPGAFSVQSRWSSTDPSPTQSDGIGRESSPPRTFANSHFSKIRRIFGNLLTSPRFLSTKSFLLRFFLCKTKGSQTSLGNAHHHEGNSV